MLLSNFAAALGLASSAHAWGKLGHETVASVASHFLTPQAAKTVDSILTGFGDGDAQLPNIVRVAAWADRYSHSHEGHWSGPLHYVDIHDDPPKSCGGYEKIDEACAGGCVVTAIANSTATLLEGNRSDEDMAQALMFVIHFLGDITQPLHTEYSDKGGNGIHIKWGHHKTNLHHIWDDEMVIETAGGNDRVALDRWSTQIIQEITAGSYKGLMQDWSSCTDFNDLKKCPREWAQDTNQFVCSHAITRSNFDEDDDLSREFHYYENAKPVIQQQIAKAGVRLAAWLNQIFSASGEAQNPPTESRLKLQLAE